MEWPMNLSEIKELVANEYAVDPTKRHVLVVDRAQVSQSLISGISEAWKKEFGSMPIIISARPGGLAIFEIEPKP